MNKEKIVTILLLVLVLVSAVQAVQLVSLSASVSSAAIKPSTQRSSAPAPTVQSPASQMVGGC